MSLIIPLTGLRYPIPNIKHERRGYHPDSDFATNGLVSDSLIRLGFLALALTLLNQNRGIIPTVGHYDQLKGNTYGNNQCSRSKKPILRVD
jgi:hypothetical protein